MSSQRRLVNYRGHVQGVGFRYTTCHIAARYAVTGYVRNLPSGGVEMVAEGESRELDRFLAEVRDRFASQIRGEHCDVSAAMDQYQDFRIRH